MEHEADNDCEGIAARANKYAYEFVIFQFACSVYISYGMGLRILVAESLDP